MSESSIEFDRKTNTVEIGWPGINFERDKFEEKNYPKDTMREIAQHAPVQRVNLTVVKISLVTRFVQQFANFCTKWTPRAKCITMNVKNRDRYWRDESFLKRIEVSSTDREREIVVRLSLRVQGVYGLQNAVKFVQDLDTCMLQQYARCTVTVHRLWCDFIRGYHQITAGQSIGVRSLCTILAMLHDKYELRIDKAKLGFQGIRAASRDEIQEVYTHILDARYGVRSLHALHDFTSIMPGFQDICSDEVFAACVLVARATITDFKLQVNVYHGAQQQFMDGVRRLFGDLRACTNFTVVPANLLSVSMVSQPFILGADLCATRFRYESLHNKMQDAYARALLVYADIDKAAKTIEYSVHADVSALTQLFGWHMQQNDRDGICTRFLKSLNTEIHALCTAIKDRYSDYLTRIDVTFGASTDAIRYEGQAALFKSFEIVYDQIGILSAFRDLPLTYNTRLDVTVRRLVPSQKRGPVKYNFVEEIHDYGNQAPVLKAL